METDLYIGKEPCTFDFEGSPVFIGPAVVVRAGHPIMKGREHLFIPLVVHFEVDEVDESVKGEPAKSEPKTAKPAAARK